MLVQYVTWQYSTELLEKSLRKLNIEYTIKFINVFLFMNEVNYMYSMFSLSS